MSASALIKRTRPCDCPKSFTAIRFPVKLARPTKSTCAGSWRKDDDRAQISKPPLLALAPQSDHGSAARAETEAFFQYGPPQSFFELSWLALQKARARKVAQRLMTGRKFLSPPLLWLAPQSDHGSAACAETEAFFPIWPAAILFRAKLARPTKSTCAGSRRKFLCPPSYGSLRNPITGVPRARKLKLFSNLARRNPFSS